MKMSELVALAAESGAGDPHLMIEDRHGIPRDVTGADIAWTNTGDALVLEARGDDDEDD